MRYNLLPKLIIIVVLLFFVGNSMLYADSTMKLEINNKVELKGEGILLKNGVSYIDAMKLSRLLDLDYYLRSDGDRLLLRKNNKKSDVFMYFTNIEHDKNKTREQAVNAVKETYQDLGYLTSEMLDKLETDIGNERLNKLLEYYERDVEKEVFVGNYVLHKDKLYIPLRDVAKKLSYTLEWDSYTKSILLYTVDKNTLPRRPALRMNFTEEDLLWLARISTVEARGGSEYKKLAVCNVVLNRVESPKFANTIKGVIFQSGQFPPAHREGFSTLVPLEDAKRAARRALYGENNVPNVLYFNLVPFSFKSESEFFGLIEGDYFYY